MKILYKIKSQKIRKDPLIKTKVILLIFIPSLLIAQIYSNKDVEVCKDKFKLAVDQNLEKKPIGDVIAAVGKSFIGTDYVAHTLEKGDTETLVINLTGLDCTTFLENCLVLARCIKEKKTTFKDYENELIKIRYRNGIIDRYPSRLHYFSDWIYDNEKKGVVKNISKEIGGDSIRFNLDFMTTHPDLYVQLKRDPGFIPIIEKQEKEINKRRYYFIPKEKVSETAQMPGSDPIMKNRKTIDRKSK